MSSMPTGSRVLCYNCSRTYARAEGGLQCPHCGSDFVEVLEHAPTPPPNHPPPSSAQPSPASPFSPVQNQQYVPRYDASAAPPPTTPPPWLNFNSPDQTPPFPATMFSNLPGMRITNQRHYVAGNGMRFTTASFTNAPESPPTTTSFTYQPSSAPQQQSDAPSPLFEGQATAQPQSSENRRPADQAGRPHDNQGQEGQNQAPEGMNIFRSFLDGIAHYLNPAGAAAYERDVEQPQRQQQQPQHQQSQPSQDQPNRASSEPANATPPFPPPPRIAIYTSPFLEPRDANRPQAEAPFVHTLEEFMRMAHGPAFAPPPFPPPNRTPPTQEGGAPTTPGQPQGAAPGGAAAPEGAPQEVFGIPIHFITRFANAFGLDAEVFNIPSDAVFSEEALQAVIQQLAEQSGPSGPRPASEEAINALPKKIVDESMLDDDGKAECSICMEPVVVGAEVTMLPCKHWFHGECITLWLKEHDSCPHCRKPIMNDEQRQRQEAEERERRRERIFNAHRRGAQAGAGAPAGAGAGEAAEENRDRARSTSGPTTTTEGRGEGDREEEGRARAGDANAGEQRSEAEGTQEHGRGEQGASGGQEAQRETQGTQQGNTGTGGTRAWFFRGALPLFPRALAGLATNIGIVRSPVTPATTAASGSTTGGTATAATAATADDSTSASHTSGLDTVMTDPSPSSRAQQPVTPFPSAAAHTLPIFTNAEGLDTPVYSSETTPTHSEQSQPRPIRSFGVSNERRRQLQEQQQLTRESQREQDHRRRQEEQDRDIGGRGVSQDFADWASSFGGMDPD